MKLAKRLARTPQAGQSSWIIHDIAVEQKRMGRDVLLLTIGDSDFDTPPEVVQAAMDSLQDGRTHYTSSAGELHLREAIARRHSDSLGREIAPEQVIVTIGAQNALLTTALCLIDPGDEIIVPEPMYSTYPGTLAAAGGVTVNVPCPAENGFHPVAETIAAAVTERTVAIFLATPNNPTGAIYSREELTAIGEICREHDLWLVSDEVYGALTYKREHLSPAALPGLADRTVTISSLSKSHAMTGWRLGWMIAPPQLAPEAVIQAGYITYGVPTFVQDAAVTALELAPDGMSELRERYHARQRIFCDRLQNTPGLITSEPEGGMFVMLDIRNTGMTGHDFAAGLLERHGVAILPADAFGPSATGYLRVNLGVDDAALATAASRIRDYALSLAHVAAT